MQSRVVNMAGQVVRTIELDDRVFGIRPNQAVVHQAVVVQQANARQGTHDTRTRGEVAGGGKKPYRQKGTGYARQGSRRAPHYRGGGVVFGPHPRDHGLALPRKMRRLALRSVLSARAAEEALVVVDGFALKEARTQALLAALEGLELGPSALIVLGERSEGVLRAARNLRSVHVVTPNGLNLLDLLRLPKLVLDEAALEQLTRTLTSDLAPAAAHPPAPSRREGEELLPPEGGTRPEPSGREPAAPEGVQARTGAQTVAEPRAAPAQEAEASPAAGTAATAGSSAAAGAEDEEDLA
jgi:large subunit ribosomal protein L4